MTKPSDFIFNSDYLALAETGRSELFVAIPPMAYNQNLGRDVATSYSVDLNCPATTGAIDEFQITYNGDTFYSDQIFNTSYEISQGVWSSSWILKIYRKNSKQISILVWYFPQAGTSGGTTPPISINISVCSFRPPNLF